MRAPCYLYEKGKIWEPVQFIASFLAVSSVFMSTYSHPFSTKKLIFTCTTYIVHVSSTTTSSPPPPHTPTTLSLLLLFFCHNNVNVLIYFFPKKIAFNPVTTILMIPTPNNKLNQKITTRKQYLKREYVKKVHQ